MTQEPGATAVIPVLSAANFVTGMGAFMVVGMLNPLAETMGMTAGQAGALMTVYALSYAVLSPLLVSLTGRIGRRRILTIGLGLFTLSCLVAALAPNNAVLFGSRILAAADAGLITPVAAAVAAGLSEPNRQARALASVFFGLTLAQVLGVPAGGFIAYTFGWRAAFFSVVVLALPVIWLLWTRVPAGLSFKPVSLGDLGHVLATPRLMVAISFTTFFLGSIYVVYTFISPLLSETMQFGRDGITLTLLVFGLGAVVGNLLGGRLIDRIGSYRTLALLSLAQVVIMPVFSWLPMPVTVVLALSLIWAGFGWAFMAAQQVRLIGLDPQSAQVLLALNAAAIYVGAALGSAAGAGVLAGPGLAWLGLAGGFGAVLALGLLQLSQHLNREQLSAV